MLLLGATLAQGQALNPSEPKNPAMRALPEKYFPQLWNTADEIHAHVFPTPFMAGHLATQVEQWAFLQDAAPNSVVT
jgi:hypothetical protein